MFVKANLRQLVETFDPRRGSRCTGRIRTALLLIIPVQDSMSKVQIVEPGHFRSAFVNLKGDYHTQMRARGSNFSVDTKAFYGVLWDARNR